MQRYTPKEMLKLFYENQRRSALLAQRQYKQQAKQSLLEKRKSSNYPRACSIRPKSHCLVWNLLGENRTVLFWRYGRAISINGGRYRAQHHRCTNLVWKACISNKMALHAIHRLPQSLLCVKCFLDASYQNLAISPGHTRSRNASSEFKQNKNSHFKLSHNSCWLISEEEYDQRDAIEETEFKERYIFI